PAHVPLHAEAQAPDVSWPRHHWPGGGLLSHRLHVGKGPVYLGVEPAEEVDRLQVLTTAELVGDPLATLSRVVEVEHRGHSVDAQAVDVIPVQPEESAGDQEALHFMAAVVEHV